jgi:pyruvate,water dikinase
MGGDPGWRHPDPPSPPSHQPDPRTAGADAQGQHDLEGHPCRPRTRHRTSAPPHHLTTEVSQTTDPAPDGAVILCDNLGTNALDALLRNPAGIAATRGGTLSHAAIVAREIGIPCATALPDDLLTIQAGTLITIDGTTGTAEIF